MHCYMINDRSYMTENADRDVKHNQSKKKKKYYA